MSKITIEIPQSQLSVYKEVEIPCYRKSNGNFYKVISEKEGLTVYSFGMISPLDNIQEAFENKSTESTIEDFNTAFTKAMIMLQILSSK